MYNLQLNKKRKEKIYNAKHYTDQDKKKKSLYITQKQKDILAAMDTIPFSSSSLNTSLNFWPFTHFHRGKNKTNFNSKRTASKLSDAGSTLLSHDQVHKSQLKFIQISQSFKGQWLSYAMTLLLLPRRSNKLVL